MARLGVNLSSGSEEDYNLIMNSLPEEVVYFILNKKPNDFWDKYWFNLAKEREQDLINKNFEKEILNANTDEIN